ncbi:hypothetical protein [Streptomyces sp. NPDC050982]|uniref:hypothetical protein n=1 Tax=Streptomyces sp. NPDC050982 TaxID=3154746 RepID=UPI0033E9B07F
MAPLLDHPDDDGPDLTPTQLKGCSGLHGGNALATQDVFGPAGTVRLLADEPGPGR